jgi:hypothetical protein
MQLHQQQRAWLLQLLLLLLLLGSVRQAVRHCWVMVGSCTKRHGVRRQLPRRTQHLQMS